MIYDGQCNLHKAKKKWCKNDWWKGENNKCKLMGEEI